MCNLLNIVTKILEADYVSEAGLIALLATIIALLIPVAILLIDPNQTKFPIDRNIVFKKIFLYKNFLALIIPVAISYLFPAIKLLSTVATIYLAILSMIVLTKMFKWLSSKDDNFGGETFKQKQRIDFLKELNSESEIIDAWAIILNGDYDKLNQHGLLDAFIEDSRKIKNGDANWNKEVFWGLLRNNFDKIKDENIDSYNKLIGTTLTYYSDRNTWRSGRDSRNKLKDRPPEALRQISQKLMKRALLSQRNSIESYLYFENVEKYLENKSEEQKNKFLGSYIDDVLNCFVENDVDVFDKWTGNFFKMLAINESNINQKQKRAVVNSYLNCVLYKYVSDFDNPPNDIANRISSITEKIFITIDPIIWFRVVTFLFWPYESDEDTQISSDKRVENWCNRSRNYGVFGRLDCQLFAVNDIDEEKRHKLASEYIEKEAKKQSNATFDILVKIFNFKDFDFSLYLNSIGRLKKKNNEKEFGLKLDTLEKTLTQLKKYTARNPQAKQ